MATTETQSTSGGLYLRRSSGLVREFGGTDVFVFNTIGYALGLVLALIPLLMAGAVPEANVLLVVALGTVLTVANALTYGYLAAAMPRSGGEYVYLGRVVHPGVGFTANWGFTWSQLLGLALYASFTVNFGISVAFLTLGNVLEASGLVTAGEDVAEQWPTFLLGTLMIVAVLGVLCAGPRVVRRVLNILFIPALLGSFVTLLVLLTTSHDEFVANFNTFMATQADGQTYDSILAGATDAGYVAEASTIGAILLAIPIGYYIYIGFTYSSYIGGEVKEPAKTQPKVIALTLAFAAAMYLICLWRFYDIVDKDFINSVVYLDNNTDDGSGLPVSPVLNLFTGIMTGSTILNVLMALSFFLWHFLLLFVIAMICTRNLFAWSVDRVAPDALTKVDRRFHSPWVATLVIIACAEVLLALYVFTTIFQDVSNYIVLFSVAFWIASFAAILLPYRRPEIFASAPDYVQRRIGGIPVITLLGVGNLILFSMVLYSAFKLPAFSGPTGSDAVIFVIGVYAAGVIWYLVARALNKRRGVDLDLLYREIPPE
ncbi:MAG TPA: APC family permease [Solirubrobacteraceae bacterium]|nr:APC family permease [Solirubrobacteraceae bacterium]